MLARRGNLNAAYVMTATPDQSLNVGSYAPDVIFVEPLLRDEDVQLIEPRFFAELDQGGEIDVAIDDIFHARLRLAHVVHTAADHEWLLDTIRSLHAYG